MCIRDRVFTVHLEPGSPAARTVESQTLELCLTLPAPFAFIEGEPEWQGSVLSLGGTEALRLDGLDSSVTIGGTSVSEREPVSYTHLL